MKEPKEPGSLHRLLLAAQVGLDTVSRCWQDCQFTLLSRKATQYPVFAHYFLFSTYFGSSRRPIPSFFFFFFIFSHLSAFSLEPRLLNDHRPRGSDHHMSLELKDLFSERRFLIADGISESGVQAPSGRQPPWSVMLAANTPPPWGPGGTSLLACHIHGPPGTKK